MKKAIIWHHPRCSKSRQTLALLEGLCESEDIEIEIRKYLEEVPSVALIKTTLKKLDLKALDIIRKKESIFKELSLKDADEKTLISAMHTHPKLIERPIVIWGEKAILGRPPENVEQLFNT